ncbi:MAG: hypothetical protein COA58_14090 [Bacteroidetes bacterium]|nr:MAG: hypothetical protein COA58_14090 [Bacteroidota bacterium]
MDPIINIKNLKATEQETISTIANWYFDEWETPAVETFNRLENLPNQKALLQVVASIDDKLIGTAGLANDVNLTQVYKKFNHLKPWVALIYTVPNYRKHGIGRLLLEAIEQQAIEMGLKDIYLCTFTAESLYTKCGWEKLERVNYKGYDSVIMKKRI